MEVEEEEEEEEEGGGRGGVGVVEVVESGTVTFLLSKRRVWMRQSNSRAMRSRYHLTERGGGGVKEEGEEARGEGEVEREEEREEEREDEREEP